VGVVFCRVEVGPADADADEEHFLRQQLHLPMVLALGYLSPSSCQ
jgi:hypothetical protein